MDIGITTRCSTTRGSISARLAEVLVLQTRYRMSAVVLRMNPGDRAGETAMNFTVGSRSSRPDQAQGASASPGSSRGRLSGAGRRGSSRLSSVCLPLLTRYGFMLSRLSGNTANLQFIFLPDGGSQPVSVRALRRQPTMSGPWHAYLGGDDHSHVERGGSAVSVRLRAASASQPLAGRGRLVPSAGGGRQAGRAPSAAERAKRAARHGSSKA